MKQLAVFTSLALGLFVVITAALFVWAAIRSKRYQRQNLELDKMHRLAVGKKQ